MKALQILTLKKGAYEAMITPVVGGALLSLKKNGVEILNTPNTKEELMAAVTSYGYPLLFPPNRVEDGCFTAGGKTYQFPLNEPARHNSLHGFLHKKEWKVEKVAEDQAVLVFEADEQTDFYSFFPVRFEIRRQYDLAEEGLKETITITNKGEEAMPVGLGFHTAFRVDETSHVWASVGERVITNERMLPTGEFRELNEKERAFREEGISPVAFNMDDLYEVEPLEVNGQPFHGAIIETKETKAYFTVAPFFRHWVIWNKNCNGKFMCIEPQNWTINAPNLVETMGEKAGMDMLGAGETISVWTFLCAENK